MSGVITRARTPLTSALRDIQAPVRDRAKHGLPLAVIADRPSHRRDAAGQSRFRDDAPAPDRSEEIVLADHPVPIFDQIDKKIKDLWLDLNEIGSAPQFAAADIERISAEFEPHEPAPPEVIGPVLRE